jgi:hypothetical protein
MRAAPESVLLSAFQEHWVFDRSINEHDADGFVMSDKVMARPHQQRSGSFCQSVIGPVVLVL